MAIRKKQFLVYAPGHDELLLILGPVLHDRPLYTDWDGRIFATMPEPYADVRIYNGETLTPAKCGQVQAALRAVLGR